MISKFFKFFFPSKNNKILNKYFKILKSINILENNLEKLTDKDLKNEFFFLKEKSKKNIIELMILSYSIVREVSKRKLNMRHFDVQILGGISLYDKKIAEIATGEGKTLIATLPVCLNKILNKKTHVITVNEYLANRDARWMFPIYDFLNISVGIISSKINLIEKKKAYKCDVVYGTCNEFCFDYLRDNIVYSLDDKVQEKLDNAIIDEADSILIDEARTPLIISSPNTFDSNYHFLINKLINNFKISEDKSSGDVILDYKTKSVFFTDSGFIKAENLLRKMKLIKKTSNLYDSGNIEILHIFYSCLKAKFFFKKNIDYIVRKNEILIIDEHTGRILEGRRWGDGLHQAVEAKENVKIKKDNQTLATITFQNFFKLYNSISGMTGTAATEADEFLNIYYLEVVIIPTNRKCIRKDNPDLVFFTKKIKYKFIIDDIKKCYNLGQPVLVGTISIDVSEFLSDLLKKEMINHNVLNAKYHEKESKIIAEAGKIKAVTIATNMAGRGTDIVLGGINSDKNEYFKIISLGGLKVIGTERHESRRIDNQLRGRSGRQGDPGITQFYLSLEDNLIKIFISDESLLFLKKFKSNEFDSISNSFINKSIENAQKKVESYNYDIRKQLLDYDNIISEQREIFYHYRDDILIVCDFVKILNDILFEIIENIFEEFHSHDKNYKEKLFNKISLDLNINFNENDYKFDLIEIKKIFFKKIFDSYLKKRSFIKNISFFEKSLFISIMDIKWREHLLNLDYLKQGIHLRGYAQKDPKEEYKREAFILFKDMLNSIKYEFLSSFFKIPFDTIIKKKYD